MSKIPIDRVAVIFVILAVWGTSADTYAQGLAVTGISPAPNALNVADGEPIRITFDRPINPTTLSADTFSVFGRFSGAADGTTELADGNQTLVFRPLRSFAAGDLVSVMLADDLMGADGTSLRDAGYSSQFWRRTQRVTDLQLVPHVQYTTNSGDSSRPYGGTASDLNHDGWTDITIVNEDTYDLRVFMNQADGTGSFAPFHQPTFPVGREASPSEAADFNGDGHTDVVVSNANSGTVSILLGNGDGTYQPQQEVTMGGSPRGVAVLDADGDGDIDIANANLQRNDVALLINNGAGLFSAPTYFDSGVHGEWPLAAGDMNADGITDLVVGGYLGAQVRVLQGNGNGTFTPADLQSAGGAAWQIALGDVNADGKLDVSLANGGSNNAAIVLGQGDGTLQAPTIYDLSASGNNHTVATDLGDIDGDGDLDWVTSSFGGNWRVYLNDGTGTFEFFTQIDAPANASCALMVDFTNDGKLDLALVDEIADTLDIYLNQGITVPNADFNGDGAVDAADAGLMFANWGTNQSAYDITADGIIDAADAGQLFTQWTGDGRAAVPEPTGYFLWALLGAVAACRKGRSRRGS